MSVDDRIRSKSLDDSESTKYYQKIADTPLPEENMENTGVADCTPTLPNDYSIPPFSNPYLKPHETTHSYNLTNKEEKILDVKKSFKQFYHNYRVFSYEIIKYLNGSIGDSLLVLSDYEVKIYTNDIHQELFHILNELGWEWRISCDEHPTNNLLKLCIHLKIEDGEI